MQFDNSYAALGTAFSAAQKPVSVSQPHLIRTNPQLANTLGICAHWLNSDDALQVFSGNTVLPDNTPVATVYAGHQFGHWNPQLGDGRAILLGELITPTGHRVDFQLKGSGPTPYSRGGDGRSPLGPVLREYLVSEAMHALGVPTTRALAAVTTGEQVYRERALPGAILTRIASSHLRVGTVQYFAVNSPDHLKTLIDYTIDRHYPNAAQSECPPLALLKSVLQAQAALIAKWQLLGFIHGVMNTDNMLLCGETVDYGPCAFMERFDPNQVFSSIDHQGRYAWSRQPQIGHWNLAMLAQALLPACEGETAHRVEQAQHIIDGFPEQFEQALLQGNYRKLGLDGKHSQDLNLAQEFLQLMAQAECDYTLAHVCITAMATENTAQATECAKLFEFPSSFNDWLSRWRQRLKDNVNPDQALAAMQNANPIVIPRNHRIAQVIKSGEEGDFTPFQQLADALTSPFDHKPESWHYASPAPEGERVLNTFCGT